MPFLAGATLSPRGSASTLQAARGASRGPVRICRQSGADRRAGATLDAGLLRPRSHPVPPGRRPHRHLHREERPGAAQHAIRLRPAHLQHPVRPRLGARPPRAHREPALFAHRNRAKGLRGWLRRGRRIPPAHGQPAPALHQGSRGTGRRSAHRTPGHSHLLNFRAARPLHFSPSTSLPHAHLGPHSRFHPPPDKLDPDMPLASLFIVAGAYLLGSIPTGLLLMRIFRKQDIRSVGSGNIGATNVLRSGGTALGVATFLLDVLKGAAAVYFGGLLGTLLVPSASLRSMQALAALCAVLGHVFPVWLGFRGGKGVATGFGVFLVAAPWAALAAIGVFFVILLVTRYVSLASILGAASFPLFAWFLVRGDRPAFFIAAQIIVALL